MSYYPLLFEPLFKERLWGGRNLERLYGKSLPPELGIGESWEISDRPEGVSRIANGPWQGRDIRWLMRHHAAQVLGSARHPGGRFPLLAKILDASQVLSLQVHPPAALAARFGGDPKTELWYVAEAGPGAELYAGLRRGVSRRAFERQLEDGSVAECFHRLPIRPGDALYLPSGRVHALGAGIVVFEIQQNSDTTYRVFDWNRVDADGRPRPLHLEESLACIDFDDSEPSLVASAWEPHGSGTARLLTDNPWFRVEVLRLNAGGYWEPPRGRLTICAVVNGRLQVAGGGMQIELRPGMFCLLPAALECVSLTARTGVEMLQIAPG